MTPRNRWLLALAPLAAACSGGSQTRIDTGTPTTPSTPLEQVMRDCPAEVGTICPWAGAGYNGFNGDDVDRLDAFFSYPMSVAWPPPGKGRPVIADWNNHKLRAVNDDPADGFETIMGTDFLGDGDPDLLDRTVGAPGTTVALNHPTQQTFFPDGTLLSASWHTHKLRTWDPATGIVNVYLGDQPGFAVDDDGKPIEYDQDGSTVLMNQPKQVELDPTDPNVAYYLDMRNERIRRLDIAAWTVDTIAGEVDADTNEDGQLASKGYCGEGKATERCFSFPKNANPEPGGGFALTPDGATMYVADSENDVIRVIDLATDQISLLSGTPGTAGFRDGPADQALWSYPTDFAYDPATRELFVADTNNHRIRVIDLETMQVSTVAGNGEPSCEISALTTPSICDEQHHGGDGGPATEATLYRPFGVDLDPDGDLIVADTYDHRFRIVYR